MLRVWLTSTLVLAVCGSAGAAENEKTAEPVAPAVVVRRPADRIPWHTDYGQAVKEAKDARKMLFVYFQRSGADSASQAFEQRSLAPTIQDKHLEQFVWAKLPTNASIAIGGKQVSLLRHQAFAFMYGQQGIAILDFANPGTRHYGFVVSMFPFKPGRYYTARELGEVLALPAGTLTQRTMIYAVRTYPDRPQGAVGMFHPVLAAEAESHSRHQASITVQGHHSWDTRFHRINSRLGGLVSTEVVAESWPGEQLVDAAIECVHSWRQSPGHWSAVRRRHRVFGFDMKRGHNGIWYATGIFGNR